MIHFIIWQQAVSYRRSMKFVLVLKIQIENKWFRVWTWRGRDAERTQCNNQSSVLTWIFPEVWQALRCQQESSEQADLDQNQLLSPFPSRLHPPPVRRRSIPAPDTRRRHLLFGCLIHTNLPHPFFLPPEAATEPEQGWSRSSGNPREAAFCPPKWRRGG